MESIEGVRFVWIQTTPYRSNDWKRILNMLSFAVITVLAGVVNRERPEVVIGVTVHPLAALAGFWLARIKRARFFFEVTDLWPESLIELGRLSSASMTARALRRLERFLFQRAERIVMLWRNTDDYVEAQGVSARKIIWIPHGVELSRYRGLRPYDGGTRRPFRIMYLGAFVESMALDTILAAARALKARGRSDITFHLVGSGTHRNLIMEQATVLELDNVYFPPAVPKDQIATPMSEADAFIYGLRDTPLYRYGMSLNKLSDYLAAARPIIFFGRSAYDPVSAVRAGFTVQPDDPDALADTIERLVAMKPADRIAMGKRGRAYLEDEHNIPILAARLLRAFTPDVDYDAGSLNAPRSKA